MPCPKRLVHTAISHTGCCPEVGRKAKHLAGLAGACRFVWNAILAEQSEAYKKAKEAGEKPPSVSFFSLGKRFTALRRTVEWLPEYSFGVVKIHIETSGGCMEGILQGG